MDGSRHKILDAVPRAEAPRKDRDLPIDRQAQLLPEGCCRLRIGGWGEALHVRAPGQLHDAGTVDPGWDSRRHRRDDPGCGTALPDCPAPKWATEAIVKASLENGRRIDDQRV